MNIHIIVRWITTHDGVSNDALGMYNFLKHQGYKVNLFYDKRDWKTIFYPINSIKYIWNKCTKNDLVIYHYTSGWVEGMDILQKLPCKIILRYHGITPPIFFEKFSESHYNRAKEGYSLIQKFNNIDNIVACISTSLYSWNELNKYGFYRKNYTIIPPFHTIDNLLKTPEKKFFIKKIINKENFNIISVARIAPHKGQLDLIQAFSFFLKNCKIHNTYKLYLIGKMNNSLNLYNKQIIQLINHLKMQDNIKLVGDISNKLLRTFYLHSNIMILPSYHEGFCLPIIESMAHALPVIGSIYGAIPETLGKTGILWDPKNKEDLSNILIKFNDINFFTKLKKQSFSRFLKKFQINIIYKKFFNFVKKIK